MKPAKTYIALAEASNFALATVTERMLKMYKHEKKAWCGPHLFGLATMGLMVMSALQAYAEIKTSPEKQSTRSAGDSQEAKGYALLPGDRIVVGVVEAVNEDHIKVTPGDADPRDHLLP